MAVREEEEKEGITQVYMMHGHRHTKNLRCEERLPCLVVVKDQHQRHRYHRSSWGRLHGVPQASAPTVAGVVTAVRL
jgi:hypothetical protein